MTGLGGGWVGVGAELGTRELISACSSVRGAAIRLKGRAASGRCRMGGRSSRLCGDAFFFFPGDGSGRCGRPFSGPWVELHDQQTSPIHFPPSQTPGAAGGSTTAQEKVHERNASCFQSNSPPHLPTHPSLSPAAPSSHLPPSSSHRSPSSSPLLALLCTPLCY